MFSWCFMVMLASSMRPPPGGNPFDGESAARGAHPAAEPEEAAISTGRVSQVESDQRAQIEWASDYSVPRDGWSITLEHNTSLQHPARAPRRSIPEGEWPSPSRCR